MYVLTGVLGILLILAPFMLRYSSDSPALWSNIILGAIVLIASAIKGFLPDDTRWEYEVAGIMGLIAIVAPFVLHFSAVAIALWVSLYLGLVLVIFAGYEFFSMGRHQAS